MNKQRLATLFEEALTAAIEAGEPPRNEWMFADIDTEADFRIFCMGMESMLKEIEKVTGYRGFYTLFEFYSDGSFMQVGAWE